MPALAAFKSSSNPPLPALADMPAALNSPKGDGKGDGKGAAPFSGNPRAIVLENREVITLEITPPAVNPPPPFSWPAGF